MGPKKDTGKETGRKDRNKSQKLAEEGNESDTSVFTEATDSPVTKSVKGKQNEMSAQPTLDKHLKTNAAFAERSDTEILKNLQEKMNKLASQEYIEKKFKNILTEELLTQKINELKKVIKAEVKKEIDGVNVEMKAISVRMSKMEGTIKDLRNKVSDLEVKTGELETRSTKLAREKNDLLEKVNERDVKIRSLDEQNNDLEQYTRRNSVRVYGVKDSITETDDQTYKKVLKLFNDKLRKQLAYADIDVVHRLGKFRTDGDRPIIVKFVQRLTKNDIVRARRALKGSAQVIREDLTRKNAKLLENVSAHHKVKKAWSDEGRIIALLQNNRKFTVRRMSDLDSVYLAPPDETRSVAVTGTSGPTTSLDRTASTGLNPTVNSTDF